MVRRKSLPSTRGKQLAPKKKGHVLKDIKYLRNTTHFLIPRAPFARLARQIMLEIFPRLAADFRIQPSALEALQEALEIYVVQLFEDSSLLSAHAKRVTLKREDIMMTRRLRGRSDVINR